MSGELTPAQASGILKSERVARREALVYVAKRNANTKLAKSAKRLLADYERLDAAVLEAGGEEELVFLICAERARGVHLYAYCDEHELDQGLVWALLSETPDRLDQYRRAEEGVAEVLVGEAVAIADEQKESVSETGKIFDPDVPRDKLRIETRLKVAGMYNRQRFSDKAQNGAGGGNVTVEIVRFGSGETPDVIAARVKAQA